MKSLKVLFVLASLITLIGSTAAFAQIAERIELKKERHITKAADEPIQRIMQFDKRGVWVDDVSLSPEIVSANNYAFSTTTSGSLVNMSAGTTTLEAANTDDTASSLTNIGFDFWFQGVRFTQFSTNENGLIRLGGTLVQTGSPYQPLAQAAQALIAPYGADQRTHTTGKVHFKVIGAAPNRTLVIEWLNTQSNFNTGGTADLTYQAQLNETTGVITFVYGSMTMSALGAAADDSKDPNIGFSSGTAAGTVGSVTAPQSGTPAPTYDGASAVPVGNLYVAGSIVTLSSAADGARRTFSFASPVPADPTGLSFTGVTATGYTLNWTDVATNEAGYVIYKSTDGVNYTFLTQTAENATSQAVSGLSPATNYFWRVQAVSEGALSAGFVSGSQVSGAAGSDTCAGGGGNWNTGATWADTTVPTATDNVTIPSGCTVTIDVTTATALNVTVQSGGTLQYITTPASTLTVQNDVTVDAGGSFTAGAGALTTHVLNIGGSSTASGAAGNLTVNGNFDMNVGTAGVVTNFFGTQNATLSGSGATADFFTLVGQKGTNNTAILDITRPITIQNGTGAAAAGLHLSVTGGTVKVSSATVATPWFGSQTLVGANGKLWINNAGASLSCVGAGTSATGAGSPTITGTLQITSGTFAYGQGNNAMSVGGTLIMDGAAAVINMFGSFTMAANSTMTMTAGNINIDPQNITALAATGNIFRFTGPNIVNFTGGMVTIVDPHAATGTGRAVSFSTNSGTYNMVGGTVRFGDGVSTTAGSVDGFDIDNFVANAFVPLGNVIVDNPSTNAATRFVRSNLAAAPFETDILGTLTITNTGGSRYNLNGTLVVVGNVVNNGTLDGTTASSRLYWYASGFNGSYSGAGTVVAPLASFDMDNPLGMTIDPGVSNIVVSRVNLFDGTITNSNKLTIGNGGATTGIVQVGVASLLIPGGNFDVSPIWNLGTGGQTLIYAQESVIRNTGFEINPSRAITALTVANTNGVALAGGDLTLTGAMSLTDGIVTTGTNTLVHNTGTATRTNGYVNGNLGRNFNAIGSYTYFVGENGFTPVLANVTANALAPRSSGPEGVTPRLTVRSFDATLSGFSPSQSISRNWSVEEQGSITADLSFTYLLADVNGIETDYRTYRRENAGTTTNLCPGGPCVNTVTHTVSVTGITQFSRWTAAEAITPTSASGDIGGRVTTANGMPIANVKMVLTGGNLKSPLIAYTGTLGYYNFPNMPFGENYVLTVKSRRFTFTNNSQLFTLLDSVNDGNFVADPQ